jgi:hypothetical protein
MKLIDPIMVKQAIAKGQLALEIIQNNIILKDITSGEAACIGNLIDLKNN